MSYPNIVDKVSRKLNLPREVVDRTYKAYWLYIRQHIQSLPLKENLSTEEFANLQTNFNIPSLGKLTCTYNRMVNVKERHKIINKIRKEKNA